MTGFNVNSLIWILVGVLLWWTSVRLLLARSDGRRIKFSGKLLLSLILILISILIKLEKVETINGRVAAGDHPFVSASDIGIRIVLANSNSIVAILPGGVPFRPGCIVVIQTWFDLADYKRFYSISRYQDSPFASYYLWMNEKGKKSVTKACDVALEKTAR